MSPPPTPPPSPPTPPPPSPTWQELTKFIDDQNQKTRNTIDFWYKLASGIFSVLLVIAAIFGWRTLADIKAAGTSAAEETAREVVRKKLEEPAIQKLIRDTASDLLAKGTFRDAIYGKVSELISAQINTPESRKLISAAIKRELVDKLAWRTLTSIQSETIAQSLRTSPTGQVIVRAGNIGEAQNYARNLYLAINASPWKGHVSFAGGPGAWAGLTETGDETADRLGAAMGGIAIVVSDAQHPSEFARQLREALNNARVPNIRVSSCGCTNPPKPSDILLYVLDKVYY
jgi:hypothetical protein